MSSVGRGFRRDARRIRGHETAAHRHVPGAAHAIRDLTNEKDAEKLRTDKDFAVTVSFATFVPGLLRPVLDALRALAGSLEFRVMGIGPATEKNKHAPSHLPA
jgi:hypothetical protein